VNKKSVLLSIYLLALVHFISAQFTAEENEIIDIIYQFEDRHLKYNETVAYIKKVNMGIPGGDNWIVKWGSGIFFCYSVNDGRVVDTFVSLVSGNSPYAFDIMKDIPGTRIGKSTTVINDYNEDGFDELFTYGFGGNGLFVIISGYEEGIKTRPGGYEYKQLKQFCNIPFWIPDPEEGPAPVEFMTYRGVKGFKVYASLTYYDPLHPPKHIVDNNFAWFFFAWDEESRTYKEIAEIGEPIEWNPVPERPKSVAELQEEYDEVLRKAAEERGETPEPESPLRETKSNANTADIKTSEDETFPLAIIFGGAGIFLLGGVLLILWGRKRRR
jgi:hypothetical protein